MTGTMTRSERTDLAGLIRKRERVMKTAASQRAAELLADFERQLGAIFSFDQDETWKAAYSAAEEAEKAAAAQIVARCEELGIPKEFAPSISLSWYSRGQNAFKERRAELRKMATTRIAAMEKAAKTNIERFSLEAQTDLLAKGLTSDAAQKFLTNMPTVDSLMPVLEAVEIQGLIESKKA